MTGPPPKNETPPVAVQATVGRRRVHDQADETSRYTNYGSAPSRIRTGARRTAPRNSQSRTWKSEAAV
jgi:hypothetical protein